MNNPNLKKNKRLIAAVLSAALVLSLVISNPMTIRALADTLSGNSAAEETDKVSKKQETDKDKDENDKEKIDDFEKNDETDNNIDNNDEKKRDDTDKDEGGVSEDSVSKNEAEEYKIEDDPKYHADEPHAKVGREIISASYTELFVETDDGERLLLADEKGSIQDDNEELIAYFTAKSEEAYAEGEDEPVIDAEPFDFYYVDGAFYDNEDGDDGGIIKDITEINPAFSKGGRLYMENYDFDLGGENKLEINPVETGEGELLGYVGMLAAEDDEGKPVMKIDADGKIDTLKEILITSDGEQEYLTLYYDGERFYSAEELFGDEIENIAELFDDHPEDEEIEVKNGDSLVGTFVKKFTGWYLVDEYGYVRDDDGEKVQIISRTGDIVYDNKVGLDQSVTVALDWEVTYVRAEDKEKLKELEDEPALADEAKEVVSDNQADGKPKTEPKDGDDDGKGSDGQNNDGEQTDDMNDAINAGTDTSNGPDSEDNSDENDKDNDGHDSEEDSAGDDSGG